MILAAGLGTRLRPLTDELPKALLPLGDGPVLAHVIAALERAGVEAAVVNAHHLASHVRAFAASHPFLREVVEEAEIRGTAGGVAGARPFLGAGPVLVVNADHVLEFPATELCARAEASGFCMGVRRRERGEGRVGLGAAGEVVRLRDELFGEEVHGADYLSVGALSASALSELPDQGCLVADFALPRLRRGEPIDSLEVRGEVLSIGDSLADYRGAQQRWLALRGGASWLGDDVRVSPDVTVVSSVLGAGAQVSGSGELTRCVLWPGAVAQAPLADAVVTSGGRVVR
jgi:mannose-1-phosphate guanylyltransferase